MVGYRISVTVVTILALAAGGARLTAQEERSKTEGNRSDRLEALVAKLGLNDRQKEEIQQVQKDFDKRAEPLEQRLWTLHQEEFTAMRNTLTEGQRAKLPELLKEAWDKELRRITGELGLNDDQRQRVMKIRDEFQPKCLALMDQKGEDAFRQFHELRSAAHREVRQILTEEQRTKLPGIQREEFHRLHDPAIRREFMNSVAEKLNATKDQREQVQKIMAEYNPKMEQPTAEFKKLHQEERAAIEKVLTPEQREKLDVLRKSKGD